MHFMKNHTVIHSFLANVTNICTLLYTDGWMTNPSVPRMLTTAHYNCTNYRPDRGVGLNDQITILGITAFWCEGWLIYTSVASSREYKVNFMTVARVMKTLVGNTSSLNVHGIVQDCHKKLWKMEKKLVRCSGGYSRGFTVLLIIYVGTPRFHLICNRRSPSIFITNSK